MFRPELTPERSGTGGCQTFVDGLAPPDGTRRETAMRFSYEVPIAHDDGTETVYDVTALYTPGEAATYDGPGDDPSMEPYEFRVNGVEVEADAIPLAHHEAIQQAGWDELDAIEQAELEER